MIPVNQFILGGSDPLLYPSEKMLNLVMFMLQLMLNIMIMLNYLKNGLVVI